MLKKFKPILRVSVLLALMIVSLLVVSCCVC